MLGDIEMQVQSLVWEDPLEEDMTTHSSILTWRIAWTEEPGRLWSIGWQRVGHDWSDWAHIANKIPESIPFLWKFSSSSWVNISRIAASLWLFSKVLKKLILKFTLVFSLLLWSGGVSEVLHISKVLLLLSVLLTTVHIASVLYDVWLWPMSIYC